MQIRIDDELCSGHGRCAKFGADVYPLDDCGNNAARGGIIDVPAGMEEQALMGMKACPERAITLVD